ncbi:hypothetical protein JXC34_06940 [Candidatus Woesearchaeota archaeon]|nr:hypothetical protein [Candidatus Woesearchaeota archaeon]
MKISELEAGQGNVEIEAEVTDLGAVREFSKFGRVGKVSSVTIKDDSGQMQLTLWDEQTEMLKVGNKIKVTNGYVKEWQGEKQLNVGRQGTIEVLK